MIRTVFSVLVLMASLAIVVPWALLVLAVGLVIATVLVTFAFTLGQMLIFGAATIDEPNSLFGWIGYACARPPSSAPRSTPAGLAGEMGGTPRRHGTTRWQVYDWRKKLRTGHLVVPASVAALPMFAELVVEDAAAEASAAPAGAEVEIVVGDVVIRAGASADEGLLTRTIRAARAAAS